MHYKSKIKGNTLIITLIFLSVVALLTFSAMVNSQLQQRMSHQFQLKILADQAADAGVLAFYDWLTEDIDHWESTSWPSGAWVDMAKQSYFVIPEETLIWQANKVSLMVEGFILNESSVLSETRLRVKFLHSPEAGRIHLDHWMELQ